MYQSPNRDPEAFIATVLTDLKCKKQPVLMPMTDISTEEVLSQSSYFAGKAVLPLPSFQQYNDASDKARVFRIARDLEVPIPNTIFATESTNWQDLVLKSKAMGFPLVLKPARSKIRTSNGWLGTHVCYAHNLFELETLLNSEPFLSHEFLVQERVEGPGIGIFLLMKDGEVFARFAHKRIREKPPSGGVSVLCESVEAPDIAMDAAIRLLRFLNWTGVAMIEFKWDRQDNLPKLMEINARFWGSLELAIAAGVDFPFLLYRLSVGDKIEPIANYRVGVKSRWELGDLDHLIARMVKKNADLSLPQNAPSRPKVLLDFMRDCISPSVRNEILRLDDPYPFLFELYQYFRALFH